MCAPPMVAAVAGGMQAAQAITQRATIRATNQRNKLVSEMNQSLINQDAMSQYAALARRDMSERRAASGQLEDNRRAILQAQSQARVAAGNLTGEAATAVFQDFEIQRLRSLENARTNIDNRILEISSTAEGIRRGQQGRTLQNQHIPIPQQSPLMAAGQIAMAGINAYSAAGGQFGGGPDAGPDPDALPGNQPPGYTPGVNMPVPASTGAPLPPPPYWGPGPGGTTPFLTPGQG